MAKGMIAGTDEIPVRLDPLVDFEDRPVSGDLTESGVQYSDEATTADADTYVEAFAKTIDPLIEGDLVWVQLRLSADFKAVSSATADLKWKWQARNKDGTWVDLHGEVTEANIGTAYRNRARSGYFTPEANLHRVPFEIRLLLQCNEANEGRARVRNDSYVRAVYRAI